jgi:hypothetical protein
MRIKLLFFLFFQTVVVTAQQIEPIQADRPDQTETPYLVPCGMIQVETGFSFQKNDAISNTNILPSTLWKYGLNENFELRLITSYTSENNQNETISGVNPILIGCKIKISDEKGFVPKTSFIGHFSIPKLATKAFQGDFYAPKFRFVMQHTLSNKATLSYNLGAEWDGFSAEPTFIYTLTSGFSLTDKIGFYAETFGFAPQNDIANHSFDGGITYLINDNFMLDLSSGFGITKNAPKKYFALGFSFRI